MVFVNGDISPGSHRMLVFVEPAGESEQRFLEMYEEHVFDALHTAGFVRAQRFRNLRWENGAVWGPLTPERQEGALTFLTIYEIEGDVETAIKALEEFERAFQEATLPSGAALKGPYPSQTVVRIWLYTAIAAPQEAEEARTKALSFAPDGAS